MPTRGTLALTLMIQAWLVSAAPTAEAGFVLPPMLFSLFCLAHPADCEPVEGHATAGRDVDALAAVNAAVNGAIVPAAKPATAAWEIDPRSGNCGDYAVSKRHALLKAGWPSARLLLAEVILRNNGEHHLVLIARGQQSGRQIWVLDNLHGQLMTLSETRQHYTLMRVQSPDDPKLWQSSLDDRTRTASLSAVDSSR